MSPEEYASKQSPWSALGRILTDAEWMECKAWRKTVAKGRKFSIGDVSPDGDFFLGYERNRRGAETWGTASELEVKRMRWRTCRRRALAKPEYRKAFNDGRRDDYATNPERKIKNRINSRRWRAENPEKHNAANMRREAAKKAAVHPDSDLAKERDFYLMARRLTRSTGRKHVVDHIIPLAVGGPHHHDNLQVLPQSINCQKQDDPLWTSDKYRDWRSVPKTLWPVGLVAVYTERLAGLSRAKPNYGRTMISALNLHELNYIESQ